jgi:hypothetical protein
VAWRKANDRGDCKRRSQNPSLEATEWFGCARVKIRQSESLSLIRTRARDEGLGKITGTYGSELGQPPFNPIMMTALLLYAYCSSIYSSRRVAKACGERVDFMSIVGLDVPAPYRNSASGAFDARTRSSAFSPTICVGRYRGYDRATVGRSLETSVIML